MRRLVLTSIGLLCGVLLAVAAAAPRTTWDGVYTDAQAKRGAEVYARNCGGCHGPALTGADGPPLAGVEFTGNWNGLPLSDLFERIRTSMPPNDPSSVSSADKADVLAHILAVNKFPASTSGLELPREASALAGIQFTATRP